MNSSRQSTGRGRARPRTNVVNSLPIDGSASITAASSGRGRTVRMNRIVEVPDPHWSVSDLTGKQFQSNIQPSKPIELGTIGQKIEVIVNYFPVREFPQSGTVYQYHIQMKNKGNSDFSREQRRALYASWLERFRQKHPKMNRYKIVFDNQNTVITYGEPLPDIDALGITERLMGPIRANRFGEYQFSIKQVGNAIDLSSLCSLDKVYEATSDNNTNEPKELQNIKQVLSIVLHEHCSSQADYIYKRTFFSQPVLEDNHGQWDLRLGKATWRGFYSALIFTNGTHQLLMNLDVSHGVFLKKQPFLDFLCEVMLKSPCGEWYYGRNCKVRKVELTDVLNYLHPDDNRDYYEGELDYLLKHCKHLAVRSQIANKIIGYHIHSLGEAASTKTFNWKLKDNELITVENYYKEYYGIDLKYPSLPTLQMHNGSFVPMEFIEVQPVRVKKITDEQRALLCMISSLKPPVYYKSIEEVRHDPKQQNFEEDPFVAAWNLKVDKEMLIAPARILHMPTIIYTDRYHVTGEYCRSPGVWNNTNTQFHRPTHFPSVWAMINLSSSLNREGCEAFYNELKSVAVERGIKCSSPVIYEEYKVQPNAISNTITKLREMMERNGDCTFCIVILPEDSTIIDRVYGELKKLFELGFGIVTQMIDVTKKPGKRLWDFSKLNNILLKINTKLNGINSILHVPDVIKRFFERGHRIMYVGVDLSHGAPSSTRGRSTVAVVASADDIPNRYFKEIYIQDRPADTRRESSENVVKMKQIMKSLISQYEQHRGYPPKAIVIYRDGISSSEFDTVFEQELTATREACVELSPIYRPYLTYIVVNKKHHTRFFPTNSNNNVVAGTVIDSHDVTNCTTYNFFLNSHHGRLGTSRPTHYHVLYDDNKLKPDEVQMLTNALCYTSARCTSSISIPAPVKYADLLAYRASLYINMNDRSNNSESTASEPLTPQTETSDGGNTITSRRIELSGKLDKDCPFFL